MTVVKSLIIIGYSTEYQVLYYDIVYTNNLPFLQFFPGDGQG